MTPRIINTKIYVENNHPKIETYHNNYLTAIKCKKLFKKIRTTLLNDLIT